MDPVLYWNAVALEVHRRDFTVEGMGDSFAAGDPKMARQDGPTATSRAFAMVHIGIYEAAALTLQQLTRYLGPADVAFTPRAGITGPERQKLAAVTIGTAASSLLIQLFKQPDFVNAKLAAFIKDHGAPDQDFIDGRDLGWKIADAVMAKRRNDGSEGDYGRVSPQFSEQHRQDPFGNNQNLLGPAWGHVEKFCPVGAYSLGAYLNPYPAHGTADYDAALAEAERLGKSGSLDRTQNQTEIGIFWGYDGAEGLGTPPRLYNQVVRAVLEGLAPGVLPAPLDTSDYARLFALVNCAMADAGIIAWDGKYTYDLWRPVVGIPVERGREPGPQGWAPLGMPRTNQDAFNLTPPFPAYPSGHATFGAASLAILAYLLQKKRNAAITDPASLQTALDEALYTVTFVSDEFNGVNREPGNGPRPCKPRTFTLAQANVENAISRVYLGVHWRYDGLSVPGGKADAIPLDVAGELKAKIGGVAIGLKLAGEIFATCFREMAAPVAAQAVAAAQKPGAKQKA